MDPNDAPKSPRPPHSALSTACARENAARRPISRDLPREYASRVAHTTRNHEHSHHPHTASVSTIAFHENKKLAIHAQESQFFGNRGGGQQAGPEETCVTRQNVAISGTYFLAPDLPGFRGFIFKMSPFPESSPRTSGPAFRKSRDSSPPSWETAPTLARGHLFDIAAEIHRQSP